jgi:hypothetical protein
MQAQRDRGFEFANGIELGIRDRQFGISAATGKVGTCRSNDGFLG